ncbi:MAG: hypothetical protein DMF56_19205 [Acidobacteria bacterium]|nr:MAG: hypothetical protein DMF56_19205 [Acidobacteriota bacterium]
MLSRTKTMSLLGLTAAIIVAQEVLLTRLLSVLTWYSLAFVVINLAMIGLTAGALHAGRAERAHRPIDKYIATAMLILSIGLIASTVITVVTPLSFGIATDEILALLFVVAFNTIPLIAGGAVIARLMASGSAPVASLYAVDLIAAAAGALLPLALLGPLSAPSATMLLAVLAAAGAWIAAPKRAGVWPVVLGAVAVAMILLTEVSPVGLLLIREAKGRTIRTAILKPAADGWNPLSYVYVTDVVRQRMPTLWARSPVFYPEAPVYPTSHIMIDADAGTPIHWYRDMRDVSFLRYDGISAVHTLRPHGTACVIGVGGGRDLLSALQFGHERVFGIEINPAIVRMLRDAAGSPVLRDPRVEIVVGDGRAVLASRKDIRCSTLQASLIDTWAATSAGAFAHTEATLYTREAWALFLRRVEPDGILTFSRWYAPNRISETVRLVSLAYAALLDRGVANPRDHIAIVASSICATILISPKPFSAEDRRRLLQLESVLRFDLPVMPGRKASDPVIEQLLNAKSVDDLAAAGKPIGLDTSAPTDDRPFFFQLLAPDAWFHPETRAMFKQVAGLGGGVIPGNIAAMVGMTVMLAVVTLIGIVLLGPTIVRSIRSRDPVLPGGRPWIYFGALGAGFMLVEIALMQRLHVVLGHPTYSLIVVLASLLVATGIGSALSTRVVQSRRAVSFVAIAAAALLVVLPYLVIGPLAHRTIDASLAVRALWSGACAALVGLVLGMLFPSGLRFTNRDTGAPAALAINGITSVLGGGGAVLVSIAFGIPATFVVAAVCYLIAAITGPVYWRMV